MLYILAILTTTSAISISDDNTNTLPRRLLQFSNPGKYIGEERRGTGGHTSYRLGGGFGGMGPYDIYGGYGKYSYGYGGATTDYGRGYAYEVPDYDGRYGGYRKCGGSDRGYGLGANIFDWNGHGYVGYVCGPTYPGAIYENGPTYLRGLDLAANKAGKGGGYDKGYDKGYGGGYDKGYMYDNKQYGGYVKKDGYGDVGKYKPKNGYGGDYSKQRYEQGRGWYKNGGNQPEQYGQGYGQGYEQRQYRQGYRQGPIQNIERANI